MRTKPRIYRVPAEGIEYQGHVLHVFVNSSGTLIISVYTEDVDLPGGYIADFIERTPERAQDLVERLLRICQGKATGLDHSLLGQPVALLRNKGRLQIRKPAKDAVAVNLEGMEFSDNLSEDILNYYPMLHDNP